MSSRQLVVLGTASQTPTRYRNHNGYLLRWDRWGFLFDPGEGTQRQFTLAGVAPSRITDICITHLHGDHCLGLPGIVQRLSIDDVSHPVDLHYPAGGSEFIHRLRHASHYEERATIVERPVTVDGPLASSRPSDGERHDDRAPLLSARALDHRIPTIGYRLDEPPSRRMLPDRLREAGIEGPAIRELREHGRVSVDGRTVDLEEMSVPRAGQSVAFIMDTRRCDAIGELAEGVDLLICESTFLESEADLAENYGHLTAAQAATIAADAGATQLVLTHFSQRHPDSAVYRDEARPIFENTVVAEDLTSIPLPPRRGHTSTLTG